MITIKDLNGQLSRLGYPLTYNHFTQTESLPAPQTPFIVWLEEDSENFAADMKVWAKVQNYRFELYVDARDFDAESEIERVLTEHEVFYETDCNWIPSERMHQTIYYVTLIKK